MRMQACSITTHIHAPLPVVWQALTSTTQMPQWMGEAFAINVSTSWVVNSPITISGRHHVPFINSGTVLRFDSPSAAGFADLAYTHWSSLSGVDHADVDAAVLHFSLRAQAQCTTVTLELSRFATDSIARHLKLYWSGTMPAFKTHVEALETQ